MAALRVADLSARLPRLAEADALGMAATERVDGALQGALSDWWTQPAQHLVPWHKREWLTLQAIGLLSRLLGAACHGGLVSLRARATRLRSSATPPSIYTPAPLPNRRRGQELLRVADRATGAAWEAARAQRAAAVAAAGAWPGGGSSSICCSTRCGVAFHPVLAQRLRNRLADEAPSTQQSSSTSFCNT